MTTFSAYASRFLSNGAGLTAGDPYQLARAGGGHGAEAFMAPTSSQSSLDASIGSDGLPDDRRADTRAANSSQVGRGQSGAAMNLMGASRYGLASAHMQAASRTGKLNTAMATLRTTRGDLLSDHMPEMDAEQQQQQDEEEVADAAAWRRDHRLLRDLNASRGLLDQEDGGGEDTPSASLGASSIAGFKQLDGADHVDPFLGEEAVQSAEAENSQQPRGEDSRQRRPAAPSRQAQNRARGWLAHAESSIAAPLHHTINGIRDPKGSRRVPLHARASGRGLAGDDIYRDPEEASSSTSADEGVRRSTSATRSASGPFIDRNSDLSEEDADDSSDDGLTSSTVSSPRIRTRQAMRAGPIGKPTNGANASDAASSLRQPLLSSDIASTNASGSLSVPLPGAFRGSTSRQVAADIYAYPHPPAKSGWTPWATGNVLQWREWKDKGAVVAWSLVMLFTVVVSGGSALAASVRHGGAHLTESDLTQDSQFSLASRQSDKASSGSPKRPSPYYTLTRSVPIIFLLALFSVGAAMANLFLLRQVARAGGSQLLRSSLVAIPFCLTLGWAWAFAGSFIYDDEKWSGGAWSTVG